MLRLTSRSRGVTLRSALRLMLKEFDLTFVVRDEVLLITGTEPASEMLMTRTYPVGGPGAGGSGIL